MTITKTVPVAHQIAANQEAPQATSSRSIAGTIYRTLALLLGIVILVVGIAALWGGRFADGFIADEMERQQITMPTEQAIDGQLEVGRIDQATADELRPYAGLPMSTGMHAKAYAGYIQDHMAASGATSGLAPEQATYSGIGTVFAEVQAELTTEVAADNPQATEQEVTALVAKEISNPTSSYDTAREAASLKSLRFDTMFDGNMLVGTLLNVYGWGLIGTIATWAGIALIIVGALLILGSIVLRSRNNR